MNNPVACSVQLAPDVSQDHARTHRAS
jgi:hypothetical protein